MRHLVAVFCLCAIALSATASALSVTWDPNPEADIASYQLSYGTSPGVHPNLIDAGLNTTATITGLTEGTTYYFVVTAVNAADQQSAPSTEVSYQVPVTIIDPVTVIPRTGWSLRYVDTEEIPGYAGTYAFDGKTSTFWHTAWKAGSTPPPHEIQIDLGAVYPVAGFRYLPRQDNYLVGNIGQYEFLTSMDGVTWGTPAGAGTFANTKSEKEVLFTSRNARFICLRSLVEANGYDDCNIAELNILQGATVETPVNQAPVANAGSVITAEDSPSSITLNATDGNGDALAYAIVSAPVKGALSGTAPNLIYTPNADYAGTDSFTYKANDGTVDSNIATVSITVTAANDAPVATAKSVTTSEDTSASVVLSASDKDGNALTYSIVSSPAKGALSGTATNLTYTPNVDFTGTDSFTYKANDGTVDSNIATVSITVTAANDMPVAVAKSVTTSADISTSVVLSASDKDGDVLTYSIVVSPAKGMLSGTAPNLTYAPVAGFSGTDSFTFKANDGKADSNIATVSITVTAVNNAPVAVSKTVTTTEDVPLVIALSASDKDGNGLTYAIIGGPGKGVLSGSAPNLTYTPTADFTGTDSFTYMANDGTVNSNIATVSITVTSVNDVPVAVSKTAATSEDAPVSIVLSATDKDGNSLTYSIVTAPMKGRLSGTSPNLIYTPNAEYSGTDSFAFRVSDRVAYSNTATVSITITPVNDAPVSVAKTATTVEDTPVSVVLSASDKESNPLTYAIVAGPAKGTLSGIAPNLKYTPAADFSGTDSLSYKANDGGADSNIATVSIKVTAVNDAPVAVSQTVIAAEDTPASVILSASDKDGNTLTYSIVTAPSKGKLSGTAPNLTYTPTAGFSGTDSFTFKVSDRTVYSNIATMTISVTPVNDAPVFVINPITCAAGFEEAPYAGGSIAQTAVDPDPDDSIVFTKVSGPEWLEISATGVLSGIPSAGSAGSNLFTVRAIDKAGAAADSILQINICSGELPLPWDIHQLGASGLNDLASYESATFTMDGSGTFTGSSDEGCMVWQTLSGDGEIIARVNSLQNAGSLSMAGVTIRESLAANARHMFIGVDGSGAFRWVRRSATGANASLTTSGSSAPPNAWLRLIRKGNSITAYKSSNGTRWTQVGSLSADFGVNCYIGLSVSGGTGNHSMATFRNVTLIP